MVKCYWRVEYLQDGNNNYVGGVFEANNDGTLTFTYDGQPYLGTWTFLFVGDEFHININLEGVSQVAADWNIDRQVIFMGETMIVVNESGNYYLQKICEQTSEFAVGETGHGRQTVGEIAQRTDHVEDEEKRIAAAKHARTLSIERRTAARASARATSRIPAAVGAAFSSRSCIRTSGRK